MIRHSGRWTAVELEDEEKTCMDWACTFFEKTSTAILAKVVAAFDVQASPSG